MLLLRLLKWHVQTIAEIPETLWGALGNRRSYRERFKYGLVSLQSHDYLKEMKDPFEAGCVDGLAMGDWEGAV